LLVARWRERASCPRSAARNSTRNKKESANLRLVAASCSHFFTRARSLSDVSRIANPPYRYRQIDARVLSSWRRK
jgi:hypothetical protein